MIEQAAGTPPICKRVWIFEQAGRSSSMSEGGGGGGGGLFKKSKSKLTN